MIKNFAASDLQKFTPNKFSGIDDILPIFEDPRYHKFTLWEDDTVRGIIYFHHCGDGDWAGFFLLSELFTAHNGKQIKDFINQTVHKYQPKRLWTVSIDCEVINKWHKFLRLTKENDNLTFNGKRYNLWSCKWKRG